MIKRSALNEIGDYAVWVGMLLMASSLPLSLFGLSLGQFIIAGGWLVGGNIKAKFKKAFGDPVVWVLWGVYFWVVIGLWNTTNIHFALDSLRIKAPLLLMPLFFSSIQQFTLRQFRILLAFLVSATLVSTIISFIIYLRFTNVKVHDIRDIVIFLSHIRLALLVCFSVISCLWFIHHFTNYLHKFIGYLIVIWFVYFLVLLESLTGIFILSATAVLYIVYQIFKRKTLIVVRALGIIFVVFMFSSAYKMIQYVFIDSIKVITVDPSKLLKKTKRDSDYVSFTSRQDAENGNLVWINICEFEMDSVWHQRTGKSIYAFDVSGHEIQYPLMRFLASKNLNKDAEGVSRLSETEIHAIEKGIANVNDLTGNMISKRIRDLAWEYRIYHFTQNPSEHSFTMRLEFWKTGWYIFKQHLFAGVGTGDIQDEYNKAYINLGSKLNKEWRLASHNEYLRTAILYGIPGLIFFVVSLFYPLIKRKKSNDILYLAFLFIALCSMLTEDTLETQTGVTFFAFLNALLLFQGKVVLKIPQEENLEVVIE